MGPVPDVTASEVVAAVLGVPAIIGLLVVIMGLGALLSKIFRKPPRRPPPAPKPWDKVKR